MSSSLDMALDDIIRKNNKRTGERRRTASSRGGGGSASGWSSGSVLGPGPDRRFPNRGPTRPNPYPTTPVSLFQPMQVPQPIIFPSGQSATKLYVSNLDYGVSNQDIKVLFSEVGELERYTIHYDRSGRSKGTAEVVFVSQTDALAAMKRYNNVHLDGKPLKIEFVGVNLLPPSPSPYLVPQTVANNTGKPGSEFRSGRQIMGVVVLVAIVDFPGSKLKGETMMRSLTAEELDADLDKYRLQSMLMK